MPTILMPDKIGTLSYSAPNVTMGPSLVTIGGQQYRTLSNLTAATPTLTANTLYCVYAVLSGGAVQIVVSTNLNSAGPSGYSRWTLVGAFLTGFAGTFGQFIQTDTRNPVLLSRVVKGTTSITSLSAFIMTNWSTVTDPFFDATNGFFRCPLAGIWRLESFHMVSTVAGAGNTMVNNIYTIGGIKNTAPSTPLDTTDNFSDDNGPWFTSTNVKRNHYSTTTLVSGAYAWFTYQSNTQPASILSSLFYARLDSIPVAIKDM